MEENELFQLLIQPFVVFFFFLSNPGAAAALAGR